MSLVNKVFWNVWLKYGILCNEKCIYVLNMELYCGATDTEQGTDYSTSVSPYGTTIQSRRIVGKK